MKIETRGANPGLVLSLLICTVRANEHINPKRLSNDQGTRWPSSTPTFGEPTSSPSLVDHELPTSHPPSVNVFSLPSNKPSINTSLLSSVQPTTMQTSHSHHQKNTFTPSVYSSNSFHPFQDIAVTSSVPSPSLTESTNLDALTSSPSLLDLTLSTIEPTLEKVSSLPSSEPSVGASRGGPSTQPSLLNLTLSTSEPTVLTTTSFISKEPSSNPSIMDSVLPTTTQTIHFHHQKNTLSPSVQPSYFVHPFEDDDNGIVMMSPVPIQTSAPSATQSAIPIIAPSATPTVTPSNTPSATPTTTPSTTPSNLPSATPTATPSTAPFVIPSSRPSAILSVIPSISHSSFYPLLSESPSSIQSSVPTPNLSFTDERLSQHPSVESHHHHVNPIQTHSPSFDVPTNMTKLETMTVMRFEGATNSLSNSQINEFEKITESFLTETLNSNFASSMNIPIIDAVKVIGMVKGGVYLDVMINVIGFTYSTNQNKYRSYILGAFGKSYDEYLSLLYDSTVFRSTIPQNQEETSNFEDEEKDDEGLDFSLSEMAILIACVVALVVLCLILLKYGVGGN